MKTLRGYTKELYELGQVVIPDDSIFRQIAEELGIFKKNRNGDFINDIKISRLGCGMTRIYL